MFCKNCGKEVSNSESKCSNCDFSATYKAESNNHNVPKCTYCGYIGNWKSGPILRGIDFVIGIILLLIGVIPGIVYLGVVAAIRSKEDNREKICPKCNAKNLWTFIY